MPGPGFERNREKGLGAGLRSPGSSCGSGSAAWGSQMLVQHRDPLREQDIHIERELHGPLYTAGSAPHDVTSVHPSPPHPSVFISPLCLEGPKTHPTPTPILAASPGDPVRLARP